MKAAMTDPKLALLQGVPLLGSCSDMDLKQLLQVVEEVDVPDGYVIGREGGADGQLAIIAGGKVRLERGDRVLRTIGPGEYIGEMALLDGGPRTTSAIAEGPVKLLVMTNRAFHDLVDQSAEIRASVFETLARRIRAHEPDEAH